MPDRQRRVLARAEQAADELDAFLRHHRAPRPEAGPEQVDIAPSSEAVREEWPPRPRPRGEEPADRGAAASDAPLRLAHPDWLHHELHVAGPDGEVAAFAAAACGSGTVPWVLDFDRVEEDLFHRLVGARELSLAGSRILAGQLREAAERRHGLATARVGHSRACPLDLHSLVPVPPDVLALGPDHPDSLLWLWAHWGTTEVLRRVTLDTGDEGRATREPTSPGLRFRFWSADWSPWRGLERVQLDWPGLRFDLRPRYDPV